MTPLPQNFQELNLDYDGKRDRWNGFQPDDYKQVIEDGQWDGECCCWEGIGVGGLNPTTLGKKRSFF